MKRLLIITSLFVLTNAFAKAQDVSFRSSVFESYVKKHVGIGETAKLNTTQLDTIQQIDLSGLDLTDISDVKLLTKLRSIDLSNNKIEDIAPLATLDSLCEVNLSYNNLKSISRLSFSYARQMYVNIAFNHIKDFSCFNTLTNCYFTIAGADMQNDEDSSFFDVDYLFCNARFNKPVISCRVNSNNGSKTLLKIKDEQLEVPTDRSRFECELKNSISTASPIYLMNGDYIDSTYIVPVDYYAVDGGNTITLVTGLPEKYSLMTANAQYGKVAVVGNTIEYTAPDKAVPDRIDFGYSHGATLKGISCFYMNQDKGEKGDADGDGTIGSQDLKALVDAYVTDAQVNKVTDVDEDGNLTTTDITKLISMMNDNYSYNGHEYVDLGLPSGTLWATCNVGASKPEEFGDYYSWGETTVKESYLWSDYTYYNSSDGTYTNLGDDICGTQYDAATVQWGSNWQLPTSEQFKELQENTTSEWASINGVSGIRLKGSNGNSIFLPAAGCAGTPEWIGKYGYYWTGIQNTMYPDRANTATLGNDGLNWSGHMERGGGQSIRPVLKATANTSMINELLGDMITVKGGTFTMGATDGWGYDNERPVHEVIVTTYKIGRHEVTQKLWVAVMGSNPSTVVGDNLPVNNVSWDECQTFIQKLNGLKSNVLEEFRLPTEAEWEYAARGGASRNDQTGKGYQYAGGYNNIEDMEPYVWCSDNSDGTIHEVGTRKPNELGIYDMSGNVCEYVQDYLGDYTEEAQKDPRGSATGEYRIFRGGSYDRPHKPDAKREECGLRLVSWTPQSQMISNENDGLE